MPVIGSPNAHARNHRVPRSLRATLRKIAHLMIRCTTGAPLLFRMTRNSRLMLSFPFGSPAPLLLSLPSSAGRAPVSPVPRLPIPCPRLAHAYLTLRYASEGQAGRLASSYSPNLLEEEFSEVRAGHVRLASCRKQGKPQAWRTPYI